MATEKTRLGMPLKATEFIPRPDLPKTKSPVPTTRKGITAVGGDGYGSYLFCVPLEPTDLTSRLDFPQTEGLVRTSREEITAVWQYCY